MLHMSTVDVVGYMRQVSKEPNCPHTMHQVRASLYILSPNFFGRKLGQVVAAGAFVVGISSHSTYPTSIKMVSFATRRLLPSLLRTASPLVSRSTVAISSRSIQTTADSSSLASPVPSSSTEVFKVKLHSVSPRISSLGERQSPRYDTDAMHDIYQEYFQSHLCDTPSLEVEVTKDSLVEMYKQMVSMRRMEM